MQHLNSLEGLQLERVWLTIGIFDGVHRGHQQIIQKLTAGAKQNHAPAVVLTFHPHPTQALTGSRFTYLTSPQQRAHLLGQFGVDTVITLPFDAQLASLPGAQFWHNIYQHLRVQQLLVGYDFAMGRNRDTDTRALYNLAAQYHFDFEVLPAFSLHNQIISSSRIRSLLNQGDVAGACELLGRPYVCGGPVIPGDGRGRSLGIPTANVRVWSEQVIPVRGVYACRARVNQRDTYRAAVNIGVRPTFEGSARLQIEAHLLDFFGDLYGQQLDLEFIAMLRPEKRFEQVAHLLAQIQNDIAQTRALLT